jgi:hypothetical protein
VVSQIAKDMGKTKDLLREQEKRRKELWRQAQATRQQLHDRVHRAEEENQARRQQVGALPGCQLLGPFTGLASIGAEGCETTCAVVKTASVALAESKTA